MCIRGPTISHMWILTGGRIGTPQLPRSSRVKHSMVNNATCECKKNTKAGKEGRKCWEDAEIFPEWPRKGSLKCGCKS